MRKATWIGIIATTFIVGAVAWLVTRRSQRARQWPADHTALMELESHAGDDLGWYAHWTAADEAIARHPAGRSRQPGEGPALPKGPDDDPQFLRLLDHRINGTSADAGE